MKNNFRKMNECDFYAMVKPELGDVELNHDCWGNGIVYFSNTGYRTKVYEELPEFTCEIYEVRNGKGCLFLTKDEFEKYFTILKETG